MQEPLFLADARPNPEILTDVDEVDHRLRVEFGFGIETLHAVLEAAHARAARATTQSAAAQFGSDLYFGAVENLRAQLAVHDYEAKAVRNVEMARHARNLHQIATALGDRSTADPLNSAGTKYPRGPVSRALAQSNQLRFSQITPHPSWDAIQTWWLLYRLGRADDAAPALYSEISLPINHSGRHFSWQTRIILPRVELGPQIDRVAQPPAPPQEPKVPVVKRADNR